MIVRRELPSPSAARKPHAKPRPCRRSRTGIWSPTLRRRRASCQSSAAKRQRIARGPRSCVARRRFERGAFEQDPVVGWLVVVGGPGIGQYRPIYEGNNTVGRSAQNRIAVDFGDDAISSEEQAYIRYDSAERSFLFVPNLAKTNVVSVNEKRPTGAVELSQMDVITMGRTQLRVRAVLRAGVRLVGLG